MPTINVTASGFPNQFANLNNQVQVINVTRLQCIKFAMTIGSSMLQPVVPQAGHALVVALYKALAMECAIDFGQPQLRPPIDFHFLETTEKSNIAFWVGMTLAGIIADQLLQVPQLMHAKPLLNGGQIALANPASRSLADLVGRDVANNWHVVEAKASQRAPSPNTRQKWKTQATTISTIGGVPPLTASHCATLGRNAYRAELADPPVFRRGDDLPVTPSRFFGSYYKPILDFLGDDFANVRQANRNLQLRLAAFDGRESKYVFAGIDRRLRSMLSGAHDRVGFEEYNPHDDSIYFGTDGVVLIMSDTHEI